MQGFLIFSFFKPLVVFWAMSLCSPTRSGDQIEAKIAQKPAKYQENWRFLSYLENMVLVGILSLRNVARKPQSGISKTAL